jgi:mycobactin salicyl-AMP ligase
MILVNDDASRGHIETGVWGRVTLDHILRKAAQTDPGRVAVIDFVDRANWTRGAALALDYGELDRRVEAVAAFLAGLGLTPDTVVVTQMPPTTDAIIVFFALLRAGLVAAPLPLALREADIAERIEALGAKAIVTVAETSGECHGEQMRAVAADLFQIRFVFGSGPDLPDGLIPLDRVYDEADSIGRAPDIARKGNPSDHAATVSWIVETDGGAPAAAIHARSHNHWIATGFMSLLEGRIEQGATILTTFAPSGLVGIGAALIPWLLVGGTLVIGLPASVERIVEEAALHEASHILVPETFARRLSERMDAHRLSATILAVTAGRTPELEMPHGHPIVDIMPLAERGLIARRRKDPARPSHLPLGMIAAPSDVSTGPVLIETKLSVTPAKPGTHQDGGLPQGELLVRGAMVGETGWPPRLERGYRREGDDWVATGLSIRQSTYSASEAEIIGRTGETLGRGSIEMALDELDSVYSSATGVLEAVALPIEAEHGGVRMAAAVVPQPGIRLDTQAFILELEQLRLGLHRLPSEVFAVPSIARASSGRVMRAGMASRLTRPRD